MASKKPKVEKVEVTSSEIYFNYGNFTGKVNVYEDEDDADDPIVSIRLWDNKGRKDNDDEGKNEISVEVHKDGFPELGKVASETNIKLLVDTLGKIAKTF